MDTYWFDVEVAGPVTDAHIEAFAEVLAGAGGIDASVQADERGGTIIFSREAEDAIQAVVTAVQDVAAAGIQVLGVTEDLVTADDIAERARVTPAAVRYWITGERGPGGFASPRVRRQRASLYSWAEVSGWLEKARLGEVDHGAAQTAVACALVNAALTLRKGMRGLPAHERPLLASLVT
jgi:hypothetical protein